MAVRAKYFQASGGLDLVSPAISLNAGVMISCLNYEIGAFGGYKRIDGYERFDGRPSPHLATYTDTGAKATNDAAYAQAVEVRRALITAVPGSGPIRGVYKHSGVVYAFRDNAAGTAGVMFKSTASGWAIVTTPTLAAGGRYEFVSYNFSGHSGTYKMYGASGVNKAFEFDGTTYTSITTGMTTDTPKHITAHKKHLFLSFTGGSVQHSPIGDPTGTWTPVTGAAELAIGDEISGFQPEAGDVLAIFAERQIYMLYGSSSSDWNLKIFGADTGAKPYTISAAISTLFLSERGITALGATQDYGDFSSNTLTQKIEPLIQAKKELVIASCRVRNKNQYRLFFTDGTVISLTFNNNVLSGVGRSTLVDPAIVVSDSEEAIYFGTADGFVHEMDAGNSFDDVAMEYGFSTAFNHLGSPSSLKRFHKIELEVDVNIESSFIVKPLFDYGDIDIASHRAVQQSLSGGGGIWGVSEWGDATWAGDIVSEGTAYIDGVARNMATLFSGSSRYDAPHTIQGMIIHYSPRRRNR